MFPAAAVENQFVNPDIKVRRTILCAVQCAHLAVRRTVHGAHTMLTLPYKEPGFAFITARVLS